MFGGNVVVIAGHFDMTTTTIDVGTEMPPLLRTVQQRQIDAYAQASGDHNPVHLDPSFAKSVGLPGTIAHGLLDMGILADAVARFAGGNQYVLCLSCRFSKPLLPGDTLICEGRVTAIENGVATLEVSAKSDNGNRVLTSGNARIALHATRSADT